MSQKNISQNLTYEDSRRHIIFVSVCTAIRYDLIITRIFYWFIIYCYNTIQSVK